MVRNITKMVILLLMAVCHPLANAAGTVSEKASVRAVLDQVFDAMRAGDAETLKTLILSDTALDRISPNEPVERGTSEG